MQASRSSADAVKADRPITDGLNTDLSLDIVNGILLEKVDKFCYLRDMLDADGGCDSAVTTRVRSAWKRFCEYLPIHHHHHHHIRFWYLRCCGCPGLRGRQTGKGFSLKLKANVYATSVRSCLMHGSEPWPMKVEHELTMNSTEMSMIRWMCGVKLNGRKKSEELRDLLGLQPFSLMIKKSRLR